MGVESAVRGVIRRGDDKVGVVTVGVVDNGISMVEDVGTGKTGLGMGDGIRTGEGEGISDR